MKKSIVKYIVSFFTAAIMLATPVLGEPPSGAELLERFDELFAAVRSSSRILPDSAVYTYHPDIIIIIEDDIDHEEDLPENEEYPPDEHNDAEFAFEFDASLAVSPLPLPVDGFAVTAGINRRSESTFDAARTIVGTARRGATVRIEIYGYDESSDSFYMVSGTVLTVGASGNFSSAQHLNLGRNFIRIKATYHDEFTDASFVSIETAQLNRLPDEVRNQLERGLLLP